MSTDSPFVLTRDSCVGPPFSDVGGGWWGQGSQSRGRLDVPRGRFRFRSKFPVRHTVRCTHVSRSVPRLCPYVTGSSPHVSSRRTVLRLGPGLSSVASHLSCLYSQTPVVVGPCPRTRVSCAPHVVRTEYDRFLVVLVKGTRLVHGRPVRSPLDGTFDKGQGRYLRDRDTRVGGVRDPTPDPLDRGLGLVWYTPSSHTHTRELMSVGLRGRSSGHLGVHTRNPGPWTPTQPSHRTSRDQGPSIPRR